jgi:DNA-binding protein HU-beta
MFGRSDGAVPDRPVGIAARGKQLVGRKTPEMNKGELIEAVASRLGESKTVASKVVEAFLESVTEGVKRDEKVAIAGFGTFKKKQRKPRRAINPSTKQEMVIPASTTMGFTASAALRDQV